MNAAQIAKFFTWGGALLRDDFRMCQRGVRNPPRLDTVVFEQEA